MHYVINFVFSIGKQPYRDNIVDILWSRPVWGGGGGGQLPIELVNLL